MRIPLSEQSPFLIKLKPVISRFISQEIRRLRKKKGLTGAQLGEILHVSQQQISRYERGQNLMTFDMLLVLLYVLEEPVDSFFSQVNALIGQQNPVNEFHHALLSFS